MTQVKSRNMSSFPKLTAYVLKKAGGRAFGREIAGQFFPPSLMRGSTRLKKSKNGKMENFHGKASLRKVIVSESSLVLGVEAL